jgi:predicted metal-binding protein
METVMYEREKIFTKIRHINKIHLSICILFERPNCVKHLFSQISFILNIIRTAEKQVLNKSSLL